MQQEIVPIHKEDLFIILNHPNAKFDYPVHYHPEYEINLVMGCTGTRVVGDSEEAFGPTDLVMVGSSRPSASCCRMPRTGSVSRAPSRNPSRNRSSPSPACRASSR